MKATILPPLDVRIYPEPLPTYAAADYERDCFLSEYDVHRPHVVIVEWNSNYYVVYGKENYKGFIFYDTDTKIGKNTPNVVCMHGTGVGSSPTIRN